MVRCEAIVKQVANPVSTLLCQCNMSNTRGQHQAAQSVKLTVICLNGALNSPHSQAALLLFFFNLRRINEQGEA